MTFMKANRIIITTSVHFGICCRSFQDVFLDVDCFGVYTLFCLVICVRVGRCSLETFWIGIFSLNLDEGFAWSDGSPVSILIFHQICLLKKSWGLYTCFLGFYSSCWKRTLILQTFIWLLNLITISKITATHLNTWKWCAFHYDLQLSAQHSNIFSFSRIKYEHIMSEH